MTFSSSLMTAILLMCEHSTNAVFDVLRCSAKPGPKLPRRNLLGEGLCRCRHLY